FRLPQANASLVPARTLMLHDAPIAATRKPVRPSTADLLCDRLVWAKKAPAAKTRKHSAVVGDMRPWSGVCVVINATPRSSSIPKFAWKRYSRMEPAEIAAVIAEPMRVSGGRPMMMPRRAIPLRIKLTAVLRCMGARFGATWMRKAEWVAHPSNTADPSRMAHAPQSASVILSGDKPVARVRVNITFSLAVIDLSNTNL